MKVIHKETTVFIL